MSTLIFKTSIKCGACIAAISPALDALLEIKSWKVDLSSPERLLEIEAAESLDAGQIIEALKGKGYSAIKVQN